MTDPRILILAKGDNIGVLTGSVSAGEEILIAGQSVLVPQTLGLGHKLAIAHIPERADVLKYGFPIGFAARDIALGAHVHVHNLTSRYTTVEVTE